LGLSIEFAHHDVYGIGDEAPKEVTSIQTFYESQYLEVEKKITYIRFRFTS
jgi:tRNA (guanine-N7-)-methyltransferase